MRANDRAWPYPAGSRRSLETQTSSPHRVVEHEAADDDGRLTRDNQNRIKRRRIALACDRCRNKKSRCDGAQPICSMCRAGDYECVYRTSAGDPRSYLPADQPTTKDAEMSRKFEEMEARLRGFERELGRVNDRESMKSAAGNPSPRDRYAATVQDVDESIHPNVVPDISVSEQYGTDVLIETPMNTMGVLAFADEQVSGFFGPSSNIALIRHISNAIAATRDFTFSNANVSSEIDNAILSASRPSPRKLQPWVKTAGSQLYALPAEHQVMELARDYFANTGYLFPYIHADTFFDTYERMKKEDFKNVGISWLALFNVIMANAMCSRTDDRVLFDDRVSASEVFYQRAVGLTNQRNMMGTSLEMVQYLLLMVQYLQGTQRTVLTYAVHGQAVRSAFQIGLQSEEVNKRFSPLEREARKRTWYACMLIDRTLSVTFGRPGTVPDRYLRLERPKHIDAWTSRHNPECEPTLSLDFYNATIDLYRITWNVIDTLYGQNLGDNGATGETAWIVQQVVKFEQELDDWVARLPDTLKPVPHDWAGGPSNPARLRTIISMRYLNLRCLLHRPAVMKLLHNGAREARKETPEGFKEKLVWQSVSTIVDAATQIITIYSRVGAQKAAVGAYWFSLYYMFNAALVLFAVGLIYSGEKTTMDGRAEKLDQIAQCLATTVATLPMVDPGNGTVEKCQRYVQRLLDMDLLRTHGTTPLSLSESGSGSRAASRFSQSPAQTQPNVDTRQFLLDTQDWALDDLDMGPFLMNHNFNLTDEGAENVHFAPQ